MSDGSDSSPVNLYSDTQTLPTPAMREAMASAAVGDEQRGRDPTVNRLCERVAEVLGKEAALYLPSGAMCNAVAVKVHTRPGDAVICERDCHIIRAECGGIGLLSGGVLDPIDSPRGTFTGEQVRRRVEHLGLGLYGPPPTLVCVEQTHNFAGGTVWTLDELRDVSDAAHALGLATHLDGARLMNAVVASGVSAAAMCDGYDSVWLDFSKGLGAPVGAALAGSRAFIDKARRYKQMFGGAMRQAGIIAAGALYGLDHHVARLADDHANAKAFAAVVQSIDGLELLAPAETNIVFFTVTRPGWDGKRLVDALARRGVEMSLLHGRVRAVTHLDVDAAAVAHAGEVLREAMSAG